MDTEFAKKVAARIHSGDELRAVLWQGSRAYGTVAGALETFVGHRRRGHESTEQGREAFRTLVDAIHAPRAEATRLAERLADIAMGVRS